MHWANFQIIPPFFLRIPRYLFILAAMRTIIPMSIVFSFEGLVSRLMMVLSGTQGEVCPPVSSPSQQISDPCAWQFRE